MFKVLWLVHRQFSLLCNLFRYQVISISSISLAQRVYSNVTVPQDFDLQLEHTNKFCFLLLGKIVYVTFSPLTLLN